MRNDPMQNDLTDITLVLDRSGSMASVRQDTIGGFNAFLSDQKTVPGDAALTLYQFDDQHETVYSAVPIRSVPDLTLASFVPRGSTALLDAIGRAIHQTGARLAAMPEADRPGKVLLVVMTDGEENSSREYTREKIFDMITHQREQYQWQIAFIGANQDAISTGASLGIAASNSANYAATGAGTHAVMRSLSASTHSFRRAAAPATAGFFSSPEQADDSLSDDNPGDDNSGDAAPLKPQRK